MAIRPASWAKAPRIAAALLLAAAAIIASVARQRAADRAEISQTTRMETDDDRLLRVEQQAPGFGGMFVDVDGRLAVYLLDTTQLIAAQAAITTVFGPNFVPAAGMRALKGDYTVSQLKHWTELAKTLFDVPGVTMIDLDEARNRVAVGVADASRTEAVKRALSSIAIPAAAVTIQVTGPIKAK